MDLEIKAALDGIDSQVKTAIEKVNAQVIDSGEATKAARAELKAMLDDWAGIKKDVDSVKKDLLDVQQKSVIAQAGAAKIKTVGSELVESESFKQFKSGSLQKARVEMKNTILNSGNTVSAHEKLPGVVAGAFRNLSVLPTVARGNSSSNLIYFSRELAFTNGAAGVAEGAAKPQATLTFEEVSTTIRTIAHFLKVSKQAMDDSEFLASYIDLRMRHGVNNKIESQIINGDNTGQNLNGWLASGNSTVTSPLLTRDILGLANKMKYEVVAADYMPDYFYMNPLNWATVETTRKGASDAGFVAASDAVVYVNNGLTPLLWGLPVILSNNVPSGTIICKSIDADMFVDRNQTVVEMFEQDDTNVQSNLITVRAEARCAALNFVPAAIRTGLISGITT
jgi:HK97 family phage major capsid protein